MSTASDRGWSINPATVRVACPGIPLNLHPLVAPLFAELIRRVDAAKGPGFMQSSGGKNVRAVRGYEDRYKALLKKGAIAAAEELLSNHSWALAGDFRAGTNPMNTRLITDMPSNIAQIAAECGLEWGGSYSGRKDPMHFEFMGTPAEARAWVARIAARNTPATPSTDFLEDLMAQLSEGEKNEFMEAVRGYNRAFNTQLPSKVDGKPFYFTDFVLFIDKSLGDIARALTAIKNKLGA